MYISTTTWRDLSNGHLYHEGDKYPFDGKEADRERLSKLETSENRAGFPLIRAIEDKAETAGQAEKAPEAEKQPAAKKTGTAKKEPAKKAPAKKAGTKEK